MVRKEIYIFLYILIVGCNNIQNKYVSSFEFEKEYKQSKIIHTMKSYEAAFIKDNYVFLKKREMSFFNKHNWNEVLLYTEFNTLNSNIQKEILGL
jgi:hypothetical protein